MMDRSEARCPKCSGSVLERFPDVGLVRCDECSYAWFPDAAGPPSILAEADKLINGQRQEDYGTPEVNFTRIARLWSAYLDREVTPVQVCDLMALLKLSRSINDPMHRDSRVDMAGYIGLAARLGGVK